ncbi:RNA polymerase C-22 sterol desaturase, partial [Nowakowskiella sp. JEL0078]
HETTANTITFAIWELGKNPLVLEKLKNEIDLVLGQSELNLEALSSLKYLDAFIKESMRLNPVVPYIVRSCLKECEVMSSDNLMITIQKQTVLENFAKVHKSKRY